LTLAAVERQAEHLLANGVETAFIGGTTGEWSSLTLEERRHLTRRWMEVARGSKLKVLVHVGAHCLSDSRTLAREAQELGALAVSALAPSYFKPASVASLVECMAEIAGAAPELPFYYYEIPSLTGIALSPSAFLEAAADPIPNLAGIKFTSSNFVEYQLCLAARDRRFDIPFGMDEMLLAALSMGAVGAVGSTYNFAAPIYHRIQQAFAAGDLDAARQDQLLSVRMVNALASRGYMSAAKAVMTMLGVDVGPARLPHGRLTREQLDGLRKEWEELGLPTGHA
jgi:N-acetylneuraminate lyase